MIQTSFNAISTGATGMFGKQVVMYVRNGRQIIAKAPCKRPGKGTAGQERTKADFRLATGWSARVRANDELRSWYLPGVAGGKNVHNLSIADYLVAPVIHDVQITGGRIAISASDNFRVHTVTVVISDAAGTILETGLAVNIGDDNWEYLPATRGLQGCTLLVIARDLPGNETRFEKELLAGAPSPRITVCRVARTCRQPVLMNDSLANTG